MYDLDWARGVWRNYNMCCPRAEQFLRQIGAMYWPSKADAAVRVLKRALVGSIARVDYPRLWPIFKNALRTTKSSGDWAFAFAENAKLIVNDKFNQAELDFSNNATT